MADDYLHPVLSCEQAQRFEQALLGGEAAQWQAMQRAGAALATAMLADWSERSGILPAASFPLGETNAAGESGDGFCDAKPDALLPETAFATPAIRHAATAEDARESASVNSGGAGSPVRHSRLLVLVGKGHNGGDALLAAAALARSLPAADIFLLRSHPLEDLRPLCRRAWDGLYALAKGCGSVRITDLTDSFFSAIAGKETAIPSIIEAQAAAAADLPQHKAGISDAGNTSDAAAVPLPVSGSPVASCSAGLLPRHAPFLFCIDGLLGMQFRPPLGGKEAAILAVVNDPHLRIGLRAAVDLPSGIGDAGAFCADFTYATGIAKRPAFLPENAAPVGRLRYLDIGFFGGFSGGFARDGGKDCGARDAAPAPIPATDRSTGAASSPSAAASPELQAAASPSAPMSAPAALLCEFAAQGADAVCAQSVITPAVLEPLLRWRSPLGDKRHYGHVMILGGSAAMPGALLFNVRAALHSGAGLVTAFAPQSVAAALAAQAPEAMWVPWPETDEGTLALEGQHELAVRLPRATALLMGSGMGQSRETQALLEDIVRTAAVPLVLDADALRPGVLAAVSRREAGQGAVVLTPHAGEFARLCNDSASGSSVGRATENAARHSFARPASGNTSERSPAWSANAQPAAVTADCLRADSSPSVSSATRLPAITADYLRAFCAEHGVVTVLKGAQTNVATAQRVAAGLFGGPVLSRGGSGDVLAGLLAGCLVQTPQRAELAAHRAVCWHGLAATLLARRQGQVSVTTGDLVAMLPQVLRCFDCGF